MPKTVWAVLVIAVIMVTATVSQAVPPPKTHSVPVAVDATYEVPGPYLVVTFTTEKHGSDLVWVRYAVSPSASSTISTELVGDYYVSTVKILVTAPYNRGTEFTVKYGILQTAGKSGVNFLGLGEITTSIGDTL